MRTKLINKIAGLWRSAESEFLRTGQDTAKWKVKEFQDKHKLTDQELKELHEICNSMGV